MKVMVTGSAGFIGSTLTVALLARGDQVVGIDNLNDYYDVNLKKARLARFKDHPHYTHFACDLSDRAAIEDVFARERPQQVVNLAAQPGVRYAAKNPHIYISSNVNGFLHILEGCRKFGVAHLVFASTSSVYGADTAMPFRPSQTADHPVSLYAATKKANEMMAHSYAHLYGIPCTGLRFFTVYGPWGRPDMAPFLFTKAILAGEPIQVFNYGRHKRSFTYVDDIVEGVVRTLDRPAKPDPSWNSDAPNPATSSAPYRLFNIGSPHAVELAHYIDVLEDKLGRKAIRNLVPLQPGDVPDTEADVEDFEKAVGYSANTTVEVGVGRFVDWYLDYYR